MFGFRGVAGRAVPYFQSRHRKTPVSPNVSWNICSYLLQQQ